ncbi:MAG TPA: hypothetical protein VFR75_11185 [Solirubrobacterales bacterium]|nr:hypothetical protein [Solirubrobacterales bacterium]
MRRPPLRLRAATWLFCAVLVALFGVGPSAAAAAPSLVSVEDLEPALEQADDGSASVAVAITNLTDETLTVDAAVRRPTSCRLGLDKSRLPATTKTTVTVAVPSGCDGADNLKLEVAALTGGTPQVVKISAKESEEKAPDWRQLWAFAAALAVAALLLTSLYFGGWTPKEEGRRRLNQRLGALEAAWKFNENWATNVTAAGAILTGIVGATAAKAFLGEDAESLIALSTVGAAIAGVFVAAAPIVATAFKSYPPAYEDGHKVEEGSAFTVGGVLFAAMLVLAGAGGQLWVTVYTITELGLGAAEPVAWIAFGIGAALLLWYSRQSLRYTLERGSDDPETATPVAEVSATRMIVKAVATGQKSGPELADAVDDLMTEVRRATAPDPRPQSALI